MKVSNYCLSIFLSFFFAITSSSVSAIEMQPELKTYPFLWINNLPANDSQNTNTYAMFRHSFEIDDPQSAYLKISAGNYYKLYVNGYYLSRGPVRESAPWYQYDRYDLLPYLKAGKNVIAVQVFHRGMTNYMEKCAVMGLWVDGLIQDKKRAVSITTDIDKWRVRQDTSFAQNTPHWSDAIKGPAETTNWGPGPQEYIDMRQHLSNWTTLEYDDSSWRRPGIVNTDLLFYERIIPALQESHFSPGEIMRTGEILAPYATRVEKADRSRSEESFAVKFLDYPIQQAETVHFSNAENILKEDGLAAKLHIPAHKAAYLQLDFGKQVKGYPRLKWQHGIDGIVVDLAYSEDVLMRERPNTFFERTYTAGQMILADGPQTYEAAFLIHSFRYMGLVIRNLKDEAVDLMLDGVTINFCTYPVERRGTFRCDDPLFNQIWEISEWTNRLCMSDLYEDCPRREQVQWVADAVVEANNNYYLYGDYALARQFLLMGTHIPGGELPSYIPNSGLWDPAISTYPMEYVRALHDYMMYSGDMTTVRTVLPKAEQIISRLLQDIRGGLFTTDNNRQLFDLPPIGSVPLFKAYEYGSHLHLNCHMILLLDAIADIEKRLGNTVKSNDYITKAEDLRKHTSRRFWNDELNYFRGATNPAKEYTSLAFNGDAVWSGLADREQIDRMWPSLFKNLAEPKMGISSAGYIGSFYLMEGLFASPTKHHRYISGFYRNYYGKMLNAGATTFWEQYNYAENPENKLSYCHGAGAHFPFFAGREVLGVRPVEPGFKVFRVYPKTLHFGMAEGKVPTPYGDIAVKWHLASTGMQLKISVPEETTCELIIPDIYDCDTIPTIEIIDVQNNISLDVVPGKFTELFPYEHEPKPGLRLSPGIFEIEIRY